MSVPRGAENKSRRGDGEPMSLLQRNKNSRLSEMLAAAEITNQASGQDSVGRTIITDWPGSITWQCAALSDARHSSSDSTQSQSGRKFVPTKRSRPSVTPSRPFFVRKESSWRRQLLAIAANRDGEVF